MSSWDKIVSLLSNYWKTFLDGVASTLILAIIGTLCGLVIGIFVALLRNMEIKDGDSGVIKGLKGFGKALASIYVNIFRGTPMMVQAMIFFFGGSAMGIKWTDIGNAWVFNGYFLCGIIVIIINTGAYMSEIIRAGLNGIEKGQEEGARSLGMSYGKTMINVIMPQTLRNALPTILNEYIVNVKDSSVLNVIGLTELYASVSIATNRNYFKVEGYIIIAVIYLILTLIATFIVKLINTKLSGKRIELNPFKHFRKGELM